MSTIERNFSALAAQNNFDNELKILGLTAELTCLRSSSVASTYVCELIFQNTQSVFHGFGKGFAQQSKLSAQFESLEHFTSIPTLTKTDARFCFFSPREIQEQSILLLDEKLPSGLFAKNANYDRKLPFIPLQHINDPDKSRYLPVVCLSPTYLDFLHGEDHFAYDLVYLHEAANGVAIGSNLTEALIHAISETVERDAFSSLIHKTFIENQPISLVDLSSLPKHVLNVLELIEQESAYRCIVVKVPAPVNISVYAAFLCSNELKAPIVGLGCSLDAQYALERAALELLEQYDAYELGVREEVESAVEDLKQYPLWGKLAQLDFLEVLRAENFNTVKFNAGATSVQNLETYLQELIQRVSCHYDIFATTLYASPNVTTVKVVLPQASDLFMVTRGILPPKAPELSSITA